MGNVTIEIEEIVVEKKSYKGLTGHWSKWGGRRMSIIESQNAVIDDTWVCQSCGHDQPKEISPFKFEYPEHEYLRVCSICYFTNCNTLFERIAKDL